MNIHWGISNKKRKLDSNSNTIKDKYDELIYSIDNEIYFTGSINKNTIAVIIKKITEIINDKKDEHFDEEKKLSICYIVDSPGGCVTSVLKFVDFLNIIRSKYNYIEFISIGTGLIASAGTIMCAVADKRYITSNSYAMIHELSSGNIGKFTHLVSHTKYLQQMHDKLVDIYLTKSKMDKEQIEKLLKNESWFNANEYLEKGLVDEIK